MSASPQALTRKALEIVFSTTPVHIHALEEECMMKKGVLFFGSVLALAAALFVLAACGGEGSVVEEVINGTSGDFSYRYWKGPNGRSDLTITGYTGPGGYVTIPAAIEGLEVQTIGSSAFEGKNLTFVTIPPGVLTIGGSAFAGNMLPSVIIPAGVVTIGLQAFAENPLLNVTIGAGLTGLGYVCRETSTRPTRLRTGRRGPIPGLIRTRPPGF
jgi:hypothetical protein